jgi:DNA-binding NtrC family response regulator
VARGILEKYGYRVLEAKNGADATRLCKEHAGAIHLLLSDVIMPGLSGPELAERLLLERPRMKLLCMSGHPEDSVARRAVRESRMAYFQKPITPESLARKVREVLDANPPRPEEPSTSAT